MIEWKYNPLFEYGTYITDRGKYAFVIIKHRKKEKYDVYIGRPSKWGNPFSWKEGTLAKFKVGSLEESLVKYEKWILAQPELILALPELKDKILGCWCHPKPCHGDILIKLICNLLP